MCPFNEVAASGAGLQHGQVLMPAAITPRSCQSGFICRRYPHAQTFPQQEALMGTVMIRCPETGREVSTGMRVDQDSFRATPVVFARSFCPICQADHEWFAQEAWVCEGDPKREEALS